MIPCGRDRREGLRAAIAVREQPPDTPVLVLSQYVEERYASELLAEGTRAVGYLLKQLPARRLSGALDNLTPREREVLGLMAEGRSNAGIARELILSDGAVEKHISSILGRLGLAPTDTEHRRVLAVLSWLQGR